jgi:hypothetical protein
MILRIPPCASHAPFFRIDFSSFIAPVDSSWRRGSHPTPHTAGLLARFILSQFHKLARGICSLFD